MCARVGRPLGAHVLGQKRNTIYIYIYIFIHNIQIQIQLPCLSTYNNKFH